MLRTSWLIALTVTTTLIVASVPCLPSVAIAQHYEQTNLVSDVPGLAKTTDPNLVNS